VKSRELLLKFHRYVGLLLALFVIVNGLTGSSLSFYREIDSRLNADALTVQVNGPALSIDDLSGIVQVRYPDTKIAAFFFGGGANQAYSYFLKPTVTSAPASSLEVWIDPYSGQIRGDRWIGVVKFDRRHLMPMLHTLHNSLLLGTPGEVALGTLAALWLITLLIGLYLAMPRSGSYRKIFAIKRGAGRFKLWLDVHRVLGMFAVLILLSTSFCAIYMVVPNAFTAVMKVVAKPSSPVLAARPTRALAPAQVSPEQAIALAQRTFPDAQMRGIQFYPEKGVYQVRVRLADDISTGDGTNRFFVDMDTGEVVAARSYKQGGTRADRFLVWLFPLHSGQAFGWFGRIVICLVGLIAPLLAITGIYLYLRKRLVRTQRKRLQPAMF
jgi:uncharacterized iron-regulated membrane protein